MKGGPSIAAVCLLLSRVERMSIVIWDVVGTVERGKRRLSAVRKALRRALKGVDWEELSPIGLLGIESLLEEAEDLIASGVSNSPRKIPETRMENDPWFLLTLLTLEKRDGRWRVRVRVEILRP